MTMPNIEFRHGERIFLPGGSGTPGSISNLVLASPGVHVTTSNVPGVNRLDAQNLGQGSTVSGFFMFPALAAAQRSGIFKHLPMSYAAILKWLQVQDPFDTCVVQVASPDRDGCASLGPAAEFLPTVLQRAKRVIAVVNPRVPRISAAPSWPLERCDVVVDLDEPLTTYGAGDADPVNIRVAERVAPFIVDGAALQFGLGKVPFILSKLLGDRRGLRLHSGMLSDGVVDLVNGGALAPNWPHLTTMLLGSETLYEWSAQQEMIQLRGCEFTHDAARLAAIDGFVAVNSALSVDLFGQCNLETASGRALSGSGGAPDFARAARLSPGGLSIVALPAGTGKPQGSRIVATLGSAGIVTLPRTDVDVIITDEGVADLRGLSVAERAQALISIAPPGARADLSDQWREIFSTL
jgi:acyl-CoA hydrolase